MKQNMLTITVTLCICVSVVSAQTFFFHPLPKDTPQFSFKYMRPVFNLDVDENFSVLTGIYDMGIHIPINAKNTLVTSLPFSTYAFEKESPESGWGNIYLGLQRQLGVDERKISIISFGAFLPTASNKKSWANSISSMVNLYHRSKYLFEATSIYANYAYHSSQIDGPIFGLELGPDVLIPTNSDHNRRETELFLHYGLSIGYQAPKIAFWSELVGTAIITQEFRDEKDRYTHFLIFGTQGTAANYRPGLYYQIYLDKDMRHSLNGAFGLKLDASF